MSDSIERRYVARSEDRSRFTGENNFSTKIMIRPMPKMLIKGTLSSLGEGEFRGELVYNFKISPFMQDLKGDDRVFTFALYAGVGKREAPKHSPERTTLARLLRKRHTILWDRFHEAMGTR
jgi:hypothetical protein